MPLRERSFELLLALFADGIASLCAQYLKPGGLLLINNPQGAAVDAGNDPKFKLKGIVRFQKGIYRISEDPKSMNPPAQRLNNNFLKQVNESVQYVENEIYYIFERLPRR